jgi:hypothetical protein
MLEATRSFSLGDKAFTAGDVVPPTVLAKLPAGRVEALQATRYLREAPYDLAPELEKLKARVRKLEQRKAPRGLES